MNEYASFLTEWRKLGILPPEGTPTTPAAPLDPAELVRQQRLERWRSICPVEFQKKIDPSLIPNQTAWNDADSWDGSFPGLWLWSHDTGHAKTRMLWRKFGQLHVRRGLVVGRITGLNLSEEYHDAYHKNRTGEFYARCSKLQCLMLDDLDKMVLPREDAGYAETDNGARNARMLRELFDRCYENHTPVLVTANEPISFFSERCGESTERRMRAVCREIQL